MTNTAMLAIGVNPGFGNTKIVVNDGSANECAIVFPSLVAKAMRQTAGLIDRVSSVQVKDDAYWVGEDALYGDAQSEITKARLLKNDYFIPALVRAGLERLNVPREPAFAVSGLPVSWSDEVETAKRLGELLRVAAAHTFAGGIRVISEPLGVLYSLALDHTGQRVQIELLDGMVLICDIGHLTVNVAVVKNGRPVPSMAFSFDLGTSSFLNRIGQIIFATYGMDLSLAQIDQAVRNGGLLVSGKFEQLPAKVQTVLHDAGMKIVGKLTEMLHDSSTGIQTMLIAGGGAELPALTAPITEKFTQSLVLPNPQLAVATGMARLARYNINKAAQA